MAAAELGVRGYVRKDGFKVFCERAAVGVIVGFAAGVEPEGRLG